MSEIRPNFGEYPILGHCSPPCAANCMHLPNIAVGPMLAELGPTSLPNEMLAKSADTDAPYIGRKLPEVARNSTPEASVRQIWTTAQLSGNCVMR